MFSVPTAVLPEPTVTRAARPDSAVATPLPITTAPLVPALVELVERSPSPPDKMRLMAVHSALAPKKPMAKRWRGHRTLKRRPKEGGAITFPDEPARSGDGGVVTSRTSAGSDTRSISIRSPNPGMNVVSGAIVPSAGTTSADNSGVVMIVSGVANTGSAGAVSLTVWSGTTASGSLRITAGQGTTDSCEVSIISGPDTSRSGALRTLLDKAQLNTVHSALPPEKPPLGIVPRSPSSGRTGPLMEAP